jgi:hypothetical protein
MASKKQQLEELQIILDQLSEMTQMEYPSVDEMAMENLQMGGKLTKKKIKNAIKKIENLLGVKFPNINKILKEINQSGGIPLESITFADITPFLENLQTVMQQVNTALDTAKGASQRLLEDPSAPEPQKQLAGNLVSALENIQSGRNIAKNIELLLEHSPDPEVKSSLQMVKSAIDKYIEAERLNESGQLGLAQLQLQSIDNVIQGASRPSLPIVVESGSAGYAQQFTMEQLQLVAAHNIQIKQMILQARLAELELERQKLELESKKQADQFILSGKQQADQQEIAKLKLQLEKQQLELQAQVKENELKTNKEIAVVKASHDLTIINQMLETQKQMYNTHRQDLSNLQKRIDYEENKSAIIIGRLQIILLLIFTTISSIIWYMSETDVNNYIYFLNIIKRIAYPIRDSIKYVLPNVENLPEVNTNLEDMSTSAKFLAMFLNVYRSVFKTTISSILNIILIIGRYILSGAASKPVFLCLTYLLIGILIIYVLNRFKYKPRTRTILAINEMPGIPAGLAAHILNPRNA